MLGTGKANEGEIDVSALDWLQGSQEFLRMWNGEDEGLTCLIEPRAIGADPFVFGMAMVDAIRHGAKAYAHAVGISEEHALSRIWAGFDAERGSPTDEPREIDPDRKPN